MRSVYPQGAPSNAHERLNDAIKSSSGLQFDFSIDRWSHRDGDESTGVKAWRLDAPSYGLSCTEEQRDAARAAMAAFDPWGDGSDTGAPAAADSILTFDGETNDPAVRSLTEDEYARASGAEEDPGEQPEIFTEEDVEAAGAADSPAYPGIMTLPDELGARRNAVLAAIATEKLTRLSIAMDPSRADFLAARFTEYQNAGALGLAIDDGLLADRDAFLAMKDRTDRITAYALSLERAAIEADSDMLSAMHAGLGDGWP